MKKTTKIYPVYHGYVFGDYIQSFKTTEEAINFIMNQEYPEDFYYEERILFSL